MLRPVEDYVHRKSNLHLPEPNTAGLNNQTWQISKTPLDLTKRYPNAGWYEGIVSLEFYEVFESIWCKNHEGALAETKKWPLKKPA